MNIYLITEYWSKENQHKELNKGVKKNIWRTGTLIKWGHDFNSSDAEYSGFEGQYHACWCPGS